MRGLSERVAEMNASGDRIGDDLLRLYLLGGFEVVVGDRHIPSDAWRSRKAAQLVKRLAISPDLALLRDQLIDVLWPDASVSSAGNSLRQVLHVARRQLRSLPLNPDLVLVARGDRIQLYPPELTWTDMRDFEDAARGARLFTTTDAYWDAIERYAGPLLPDDLYEDWTDFCRDSLEVTYIDLLNEVARIHDEQGEFDAAIAALQRLISIAPNHEPAHRELMRIFFRCGNRTRAISQYEQLCVNLARSYEITPDAETRDLYLHMRELTDQHAAASEKASVALLSDGVPIRGNLPHPVSRFIGREEDVRSVERQVRAHRLVTLVGAGGIGKTRLAIEAAHRLGDRFPGGIWLISLASLVEPSLIAQTVAEAVGMEVDTRRSILDPLAEFLCSSQTLLILDNCEHLIGACAEIAGDLLNACPHLHVLATSRESLRIHGEHPWAVPGLSVPSTNESESTAMDFDSVQLFVDRVTSHSPDFNLDPENVAHVCIICRRLDGMPLALELAAARTSTITLSQLVSRLDDALKVLTGGSRRLASRQQTLRATLDWSFQLLSVEERVLFRRLAIFSGGWTLEMAELVCADDQLPLGFILEQHSQLASKSLIQVELDGELARYRLLEPVRQYAQERLNEAGESNSLTRRLALYFADLLERIEPGLSGPRQARHFMLIEREHDNVRAALRWAAQQQDPELALRIEAIMWRYWGIRWHSEEGLRWIEATLARPCDVKTRARARAALGAGELARRILRFDLSLRLFNESLDIHRELGDVLGTAWSLSYLSNAAIVAGFPERASQAARESLNLFRSVNDRHGMARALNVMGEESRVSGDYAAAERFYREALDLDRAVGDQQGIAVRLHNLGYVELQKGRMRLAARSFRDAFVLDQELGYRTGPLSFLEGMAAVMCAAGYPELGARLYGAWEANCALPGTEFKLHPPDQREFDRYAGLARAKIGSEKFAACWTLGAQMSLDEAIAAALTAEQCLSLRYPSSKSDDLAMYPNDDPSIDQEVPGRRSHPGTN